MSTSPAPQVSRGDLSLQPSYFTSSLFVYPLREDISQLTQIFSNRYFQSDRSQPFALFKTVWNEQGWTWLHLKVFDARARERFLDVVLRLFLERLIAASHPMAKAVALFGMYTFYFSQPSTSSPSLHSLRHIAVPIDIYRSMLELPSMLGDEALQPLRPYTTHVLSRLLDAQAFHILPEASLRPQNPSTLPREMFIPDGVDPSTILGIPTEASSSGTNKPPKKKGRPSKRDKAKRAKDAVTSLDRWLEKNTFTYPPLSGVPGSEGVTEDALKTTHALIAHRPMTLQQNYSSQKAQLLTLLEQTVSQDETAFAPSGSSTTVTSDQHQRPGRGALLRANEAILARLKKIDEMAAEQGLEVGGEGGDMTGLSRVERAVVEFREGRSRGGILNLMEGAGTETEQKGGEQDTTMQEGSEPNSENSQGL